MSDEEGGCSSRSSASGASSAGSEQFARDVATMTDKIEAAEAATRLTKQQYTAANQSHKGTATNLTTKTKAQKEAKAALVARDALHFPAPRPNSREPGLAPPLGTAVLGTHPPRAHPQNLCSPLYNEPMEF